MKVLDKIFNKYKPFTLRFSKSNDEWELLYNSKVIYLGDKEGCIRYMEFVKMHNLQMNS